MLAKIYEQNPSEKELQRVVDALERDEIIIYPTDSVYAFGCSLRSPKAIERLRRIRGKSEEKFTVVFENIAQVAEYCRVDNAVFRILKRNLPGPFTFVLAASARIPDKALERRRTIGVRIPASPVARAVVGALGCPMITTSVGGGVYDRSRADPRALRPRGRAGHRRRHRRQRPHDGRGPDGRRAGDTARRQG